MNNENTWRSERGYVMVVRRTLKTQSKATITDIVSSIGDREGKNRITSTHLYNEGILSFLLGKLYAEDNWWEFGGVKINTGLVPNV